MVGCGASLMLTRRLGAQPWLSVWPQCLLLLAMTAELWLLEDCVRGFEMGN